MRIAALIFGLMAGVFALLTPILPRGDLMTPFLEYWAAGGDGRPLASIVWYALPVLALLGGLLSTVSPGFAALLLLAAACGWAGIGLTVPGLLDYRILAPSAAAGIATVLAFVAGELQIRASRVRRRNRRSAAALADDGEIEREAALRMDPLVMPREDVPASSPTPKRSMPLTIDDVAVVSRPSGPPPRWEDLDAAEEPEPVRAPDTWGEAIRPQTREEPPAAPSQFRWDDLDAPDFMAGSSSTTGPRFEPRREPAAAPPPPPPPPRPRVDADPAPEDNDWPEPTTKIDTWPDPRNRTEPRERTWTPAKPQASRQSVRRSRVLVPVLSGIAAVFATGLLLGGGYYAYRTGLMDGVIALVQPQSVAPVEEEPATTVQADSTGISPTTAVSADTPNGSATPPPVAPALVSPPVAPAPTEVAAATYDDPFAYCQAVGTVDYVDQRYGGPAVVEAITRALSVGADARRDRVRWRCMNGQVLACTSYAGPVCDMVPSVAEMRAYCQLHRDVEVLLAPHGNWSCVGGRPQLPADASWRVDSRGFMPRAWLPIRPEIAPAT